jgi:general stress protein 26
VPLPAGTAAARVACDRFGHRQAMSDHAPARPLDDLLKPGDTVMLMTMIGDEHSSRPMTVAEIDGSRIGLLVDTTAEWTAAVAQGIATVHVTLSDVRANRFVALNGTCSMSADRADAERLWNPAAGAFFDGKDDPNLFVLFFDVTEGEYWDSPDGRIGALISLVRAAIGGDDKAGDHGPVMR